MTRSKMIRMLLGLMLVSLFFVGSLYIHHPVFVGRTMGTTYSITISGYVSRSDKSRIEQQVTARLATINLQMSTWMAESEISAFNELGVDQSLAISPGFSEVIRRSLALSASTDGAFDPTLGPLLDVWGFSHEGAHYTVPSATDVAAAKALTGWHLLRLDEDSVLTKTMPGLALDLGAIAKGYGVDALAEILMENGYLNWFVEVGGEVQVMGENPAGDPWRIGIQYPSADLMDLGRLQGLVCLEQGAVATSGNYRNYVEKDGLLYSHILDPRTGQAIHSDLASVTVYAPQCMDADGVATALFVMGVDEGLRWINEMPDMEALFLVWDSSGKIVEKFSSEFCAQTSYIPASQIPRRERDE